MKSFSRNIFKKIPHTQKNISFLKFLFFLILNMLQLWEQYIQVHAVSFCFNMLCIHKHKEILQAVWINFTKISEEKKISTCETYSMLQMQWHIYLYIIWFIDLEIHALGVVFVETSRWSDVQTVVKNSSPRHFDT